MLTGTLLLDLEEITARTVHMLAVLAEQHALIRDDAAGREVKRRTLELRARAQELFEYLDAVELEAARH